MIDNLVRNARIKYQSLSPIRRRILFAIATGFLLYFWTISSFSSTPSQSGHHTKGAHKANGNVAVDNRPVEQQAGNVINVEDDEDDEDEDDSVAGETYIVLSGFGEENASEGLKQASAIYLERGRDVSIIIPASPRVVEEIASKLDIPLNDLIIDDDSETVAENAIFVSSLAKEKNTKEIIVITYDYSILRTQYIFNTILSSSIPIEFLGTETPAEERAVNWRNEYTKFAAAETELKNKGIINEKEAYGYHPIRNLPRWMMIDRELENDIRSDPNLLHQTGEAMVMIDYGSNYGYFSVHLAQKFPKGTMLSLEGEATTEYRSAATIHKEKLEELKVKNNYICRTKTQPEAFTALHNQKQIYAYQLCLSVFHWFRMPTKQSFEEALYNHLTNSRTTFIELPEARKYDGREGQHAWDWVNIWYEGRTEVQIIHDLAKKYNWGNYEVKILGAIIHDNRTVRKMLRVDLLDNLPSVDVSIALKTYGCKEENTFFGAN